MSDGLRQGERCLYVATSRANFRRFRAALDDTGADVAEAVRRGALVEVTHADAHLAGGYFDSERMLALLNDAVESALNDGFKGLRACGDMSWLLVERQGHEQAMEYEALLNQLFRELRASGMCQYDRRRFAATVLDAALTTHSR